MSIYHVHTTLKDILHNDCLSSLYIINVYIHQHSTRSSKSFFVKNVSKCPFRVLFGISTR